MKKYELTQEQINQLAEKKHAKELLKEFLPEAFENELEVGEIWKPIHNYEEFYEVSNYGNVRTIPRQVKHSRNKEYSRSVKSKLLLKSRNQQGYFKVLLSKEGIKKTHLIHHLVAESFLNHYNRNNFICVDHIDENKLNNNVNNLQIITKKENTKKSFDFKLEKFVKGDYWFHNTGSLNLIIDITKKHGGTIKTKPIYPNSNNYSFHSIKVMQRKATEEEVREALINEAIKRGYKKGVKCKFGTSKEIRTIETNKFFFDFNSNKLYLRHSSGDNADEIFRNGFWAEIVIEDIPTQEEIDRVINYLKNK